MPTIPNCRRSRLLTERYRSIKRILGVEVLTLAASSFVLGQTTDKKAAPSGTAEQELMQVGKQTREAAVSGDLSALDRLHADDFTAVTADGTLITKAEMKAAFKSGDVKYESINNEDEKWRIYGNTAVYTALST
ncbi:MAG: nuclear transport factor 2 family protein, partial [Pyrinomonadaceae bacterium]|nr:nuclear transport factor 2 family protein [Pyrinomonadaceae bacterium]